MLKHGLAVVLSIVAGSFVATAQQPSRTWRDPSPHQVWSVTVAEGVTLELLDWGGSGRPIVLLAGSGNSAHVFDEFAPKLTDCCHVYGITRRGHGASSRPPSGYDDQRLAEDVFQVLEREPIQRPVLMGHSAAGGEMTTMGRLHSDRLSGLVYLDALGDLEDDPAADAEWVSLQQKLPTGLIPPAVCDPPDRSTFDAFRQSLACRMGFAFPVSELRNMFEDLNGRVGAARMPEWVSPAMGKGQVSRRDYSNIRVPVLALMNFAPTTEAILADTGYKPRDEEERAAIDRFAVRSRIIIARHSEKLTRHVPNARIVYLGHVGHYVFMTREDVVLREIRSFLAGLNGQ